MTHAFPYKIIMNKNTDFVGKHSLKQLRRSVLQLELFIRFAILQPGFSIVYYFELLEYNSKTYFEFGVVIFKFEYFTVVLFSFADFE